MEALTIHQLVDHDWNEFVMLDEQFRNDAVVGVNRRAQHAVLVFQVPIFVHLRRKLPVNLSHLRTSYALLA